VSIPLSAFFLSADLAADHLGVPLAMLQNFRPKEFDQP
jgi:hypothetical protein